MKITPQMYSEMSKDASPKSNSKVNVPVAFLVGGAICALGQLIMSVLMNCGLGKENAGTWTSIILVGLSSLLTGLGWYEKLAKLMDGAYNPVSSSIETLKSIISYRILAAKRSERESTCQIGRAHV